LRFELTQVWVSKKEKERSRLIGRHSLSSLSSFLFLRIVFGSKDKRNKKRKRKRKEQRKRAKSKEQRAKKNDNKQGLLFPLDIPNKSWDSISMDFITHLPVSHQGNTSAMAVVDRLSKMAHFSAMKDSYSAKDVANWFFLSIFRLHGLPSSIVLDRDSRFTGSFWKELMLRLGSKLIMSTVNLKGRSGP